MAALLERRFGLANLLQRRPKPGRVVFRRHAWAGSLAPGAELQDAVADLKLKSPQWRIDEGYTQSFGIKWLKSAASLGLWVPSSVEPQERNLLLNPAHPHYGAIRVVIEVAQFEFDSRLF